MESPAKVAAKKKKLFLRALAHTGNVSASCDSAGLHRSSVYEARIKDKKFRSAWESAIDSFMAVMQDQFLMMVHDGYTETRTTMVGPNVTEKIITTKRLPTLQFKTLQTRHPRWKAINSHELAGPDGGPIETKTRPTKVDTSALSDAELEQYVLLTEKMKVKED